MGSKPKTPGPSSEERALAGDAAYKWNDYVERYIPVENAFLDKIKATPDKVMAARGAVNADAGMAYGQAARAAHTGLAAQGAAPSAGRSALGASALADAFGGASGQGQAQATQGVHDRQQTGLTKMSAFGRNLQDSTSLSLGDSARRATDSMLSDFERKIERRNMTTSSLVSAAGMGVAGFNAYNAVDPTTGKKAGMSGLRAAFTPKMAGQRA